jgi:type IV secretory pathway VirB4 component
MQGVVAQRRVQEANAELAEERNRMHALLQRQYELIEIMQSTASNNSECDPQTQSLFKEKIQVLRDILSEARGSDREVEEIRMGKILGEGNVSASISCSLIECL